jgi:hypothetical protein
MCFWYQQLLYDRFCSGEHVGIAEERPMVLLTVLLLNVVSLFSRICLHPLNVEILLVELFFWFVVIDIPGI